MSENRFHFSAVISVIYGYKFSEETLPLLSYLLGRKITDKEMPEAIPLCQEYLKEKFPDLCTTDIEMALKEMEVKIDSCNHTDSPIKIITDFLKKVKPRDIYGSVTLKPLKSKTDQFDKIRKTLNWV